MSIKLVAIDIDGTLINSKHELTPEVKQAIIDARKKNVKIVLCTGRPLPGVEEFLGQLDMTGKEDFVISYNGSMVQNAESKEILFSASLSQDDYLAIYSLALKLGVHLHVSGKDSIYTANRDLSPYTIFESSLVHMPVKYRTAEEMLAEQIKIVKMMMIDDPEILDQAIENIPIQFKEKYTIVKSTPFYLELLNKKASKGNALKALSNYLGIPRTEIMAIGDNENDLSMIEYAEVGVAMQNAIPKLKEVSNFVTSKTNDENGVAEALRKFIV